MAKDPTPPVDDEKNDAKLPPVKLPQGPDIKNDEAPE